MIEFIFINVAIFIIGLISAITQGRRKRYKNKVNFEFGEIGICVCTISGGVLLLIGLLYIKGIL